MRDFHFLAHCEFSMQDIKYHCFILGFDILFLEGKTILPQLKYFFLKVVKLLQLLCGYRQIAELYKYCFV